MQLEIGIMLKIITEQKVSSKHIENTCVWPHPWEHYPFLINGKRKWVRYQDLEIEQKQLISNTLNEIVWPQAFGEYLLRVSVSHVRTFQYIRQYL